MVARDSPNSTRPLLVGRTWLVGIAWAIRKGDRPIRSCHLAGFRCLLPCVPQTFLICRGSFSRFDCGFNRRYQFQFRLFRSAMVVMMKRLVARSFCIHPPLSVGAFLAFVLKVFRNRLRCHGTSVAELAPSKLCNFGHSVRTHGLPRTSGDRIPGYRRACPVRRQKHEQLSGAEMVRIDGGYRLCDRSKTN